MSAPVFSKVLVGWDASRAATTGLVLACRLTATTGGTVNAVSVVPTFTHIEADDDRQRAIADAHAPLQAQFDLTVQSLTLHPEQQVSLRFLADEHVADALDHYAAEQMIDLLIVGLHGREGILHPRMGHIANHVIKSSSCPVLVVPDEQATTGTIQLDEPSHLSAAVKGLFHPGRHHDPHA
jgi:nucleotide-binding universal stress UspA family protein